MLGMRRKIISDTPIVPLLDQRGVFAQIGDGAVVVSHGERTGWELGLLASTGSMQTKN